MMGLLTDGIAQEEPITEQGYEREELGVNRYEQRSSRNRTWSITSPEN